MVPRPQVPGILQGGQQVYSTILMYTEKRGRGTILVAIESNILNKDCVPYKSMLGDKSLAGRSSLFFRREIWKVLTTLSQLSASHIKRFWGSDKYGAVFWSIDNFPACFCMGRCPCLEPVLLVATYSVAIRRLLRCDVVFSSPMCVVYHCTRARTCAHACVTHARSGVCLCVCASGVCDVRIRVADLQYASFANTKWLLLLPWPKKLRQARKPNIGTCMLDRSRACATCAVVSIFLARVVVESIIIITQYNVAQVMSDLDYTTQLAILHISLSSVLYLARLASQACLETKKNILGLTLLSFWPFSAAMLQWSPKLIHDSECLQYFAPEKKSSQDQIFENGCAKISMQHNQRIKIIIKQFTVQSWEPD